MGRPSTSFERSCLLPSCGRKFMGAPSNPARFCSHPCFRTSRKTDVAERFWSKVDKDGPVPEHVPGLGPCWVWTASLTMAGYGQFMMHVRGRPRPIVAHRVAYELSVGDLGALQANHRCDNRRCVNPSHLFAGTQQDNIQDALGKDRMLLGEKNGNSKLTVPQVQEIKVRLSVGETPKDIAPDFGVSADAIYQIKRGNNWSQVACPGPFGRAA